MHYLIFSVYKKMTFSQKNSKKKSSAGLGEMMCVQAGRLKAPLVGMMMSFCITWLPHCGVWPYLDLGGCWGTVWDNQASLFHLSCYFLQFQVTDFKSRVPKLVADPIIRNHFFSWLHEEKSLFPNQGLNLHSL